MAFESLKTQSLHLLEQFIHLFGGELGNHDALLIKRFAFLRIDHTAISQQSEYRWAAKRIGCLRPEESWLVGQLEPDRVGSQAAWATGFFCRSNSRTFFFNRRSN